MSVVPEFARGVASPITDERKSAPGDVGLRGGCITEGFARRMQLRRMGNCVGPVHDAIL